MVSYDASPFLTFVMTAPCLPQYLITAMAVAVCRHGHILMMANCTGGEKHGYAIMCLSLLLLAGIAVKAWWYDINCRYRVAD